MFVVEVISIFALLMLQNPAWTATVVVILIIYDNVQLYRKIKEERSLISELEKTLSEKQ